MLRGRARSAVPAKAGTPQPGNAGVPSPPSWPLSPNSNSSSAENAAPSRHIICPLTVHVRSPHWHQSGAQPVPARLQKSLHGPPYPGDLADLIVLTFAHAIVCLERLARTREHQTISAISVDDSWPLVASAHPGRPRERHRAPSEHAARSMRCGASRSSYQPWPIWVPECGSQPVEPEGSSCPSPLYLYQYRSPFGSTA